MIPLVRREPKLWGCLRTVRRLLHRYGVWHGSCHRSKDFVEIALADIPDAWQLVEQIQGSTGLFLRRLPVVADAWSSSLFAWLHFVWFVVFVFQQLAGLDAIMDIRCLYDWCLVGSGLCVRKLKRWQFGVQDRKSGGSDVGCDLSAMFLCLKG